jgi:hypothetical protein
VLAGRRERERLERLRWLLERLFADWMREAWRRWCLLPPRARPGRTRRRRRKPVTGGVAAKLRGRREPCECVMRMLKLNGPAPFRCTHERHMLNRMEDSVQLLEDAAINIAEATDAHDDGGICEEEEEGEEESDEDDGDYGEDGDPFERSVDTFNANPGGGWSEGNGKLFVDLDRGWGAGRGRGVLPQESSDGPTTGTSSGTGSGGERVDDVDDFGEMKMGGTGGAGSSRGEQKEERRRHGSGRGGSSGKMRSGSDRGRGGGGGGGGGSSGALWDAGAILGGDAAWNDGGGDGGIGGGRDLDSSTFDDPLADLSSSALGDDGNMVRGRGEGRVMSMSGGGGGGGGSSSVRTESRDSGLRRSVRSSRGSDRGSAARTNVRSSAGKSSARSGAKSAPRSSHRSSSKGENMRGSKTGGSSSKLQPTPWREAFKCIVPECEKTCATKSAWESHMRMHETQREREETAALRRSLRQSRTMANEGDSYDGGGGGGEAQGERLTASTPNPLRSSCDGGNGWDGGGAPSPPGTGPGTGSTAGTGNRTAVSLSGLPRRALWNSGARGAVGAGGVNMSGISPAFGVLSGSVRSSQGGGQHPHAQRRMSTRGPTAYPVRNW